MRPTSAMSTSVQFYPKSKGTSHHSPTLTFSAGETVWGHLKHISQGRSALYSNVNFPATHELTVDKNAQAVEGNRLVAKGRTYQIVAVEDLTDTGLVNLVLSEVVQ